MNAPRAGKVLSDGVGPMPPAPEPEQQWHRLNARMIIVKPIHEGVRLIPFLAILLLLGRGDPQHLWWSLGAIGLLILSGVLHWWRTSYRITPEQVELHTGLFNRQRLAVRRDRIRTVETTVKFGHRIFGLAEVRIGTGQHEQKRKGPFSLDAVTAAEAERLRTFLLRRPADPTIGASPADISGADAAHAASEPLAGLDRRWLRYAPLTLSGITSVGVVIGFGFRALNEAASNPSTFGPIRAMLGWVGRSPLTEVIVVAIAIAAVVVTLASLLGYLLQFWNYQLSREADGTLRVRRGLFTTRSISIEEALFRGVMLRQQLLLRFGGGARLSAIATGLDRRNESGLLLPPAPLAEANRVSGLALRTRSSPMAAPLTAHPRRALWRRLIRSVGAVAVLAVVLGLATPALHWPDWPWIVALALLPAAVALGFDRYRALGHTLTKRYLVTRQGSLRRDTAALQRTGIIGWQLRVSWFQRRAGLATLSATTAAGHGSYHVTDLGVGDAVRLADEALPDLLTPFLR